jgi:hypothetical protein
MAAPPDRPSAAFGDCSSDAPQNIARERAAAAKRFPSRELTHLLDGSAHMTACKEKVMRQLESLPDFRHDGEVDLTKAEMRTETLRRIRNTFRLFLSDHGDLDMREARLAVTNLYSSDWSTRNGVHFGLFLSAITSQGTREQQDEWVTRGMGLSIFGCFAMTELRGGSFVRGLETVRLSWRGLAVTVGVPFPQAALLLTCRLLALSPVLVLMVTESSTFIHQRSRRQNGGSEAVRKRHIRGESIRDGICTCPPPPSLPHSPAHAAHSLRCFSPPLSAGETATHAAVYARLVVKGEDLGVHT